MEEGEEGGEEGERRRRRGRGREEEGEKKRERKIRVEGWAEKEKQGKGVEEEEGEVRRWLSSEGRRGEECGRGKRRREKDAATCNRACTCHIFSNSVSGVLCFRACRIFFTSSLR